MVRSFQRKFFFFSLLGCLFLWDKFVFALHYACRYRHWGFRFILESVWLGNSYSLHLNLDFVHMFCTAFKNNCKVTRFDPCHMGESRWSTWISQLDFKLSFHSLRSSMFLGERWLLKRVVLDLFKVFVYLIVINQSHHHFFVLFFKLSWLCRMSYYLVKCFFVLFKSF